MADHIIGITLERDGRTVPLHPDVERVNAEGDSTKIGLTTHPVAFLSPSRGSHPPSVRVLAANVRCTKAPMGNPCVCGPRASTAWKRFDRRSSGGRDPEPAHNASIAAAPPRPHRAPICRNQLPDLQVGFFLTDDPPLRGALPISDFHPAIRSHCPPIRLGSPHSLQWMLRQKTCKHTGDCGGTCSNDENRS